MATTARLASSTVFPSPSSAAMPTRWNGRATPRRGDLLRDTEEYNALTQQLYELHDQIEILQAARHTGEPGTPDLTSDRGSPDRSPHAP